jgi:hypothetical protein
MIRRIANPIAVRRYTVAGEPGREIVLTIGKPRPDPRPGGDWMCSVLIEGIPKERRLRAHGVDAVQALQDAMACARHELDASGLPVVWLDNEPGDMGLPLSIPGCWGLEFERKLERYVNRQVKRMNDAVTAFLEMKERQRQRSLKP